MPKNYAVLLIISVFTWVGFLGGISFLEAWLKFRAPGVTLPIGLGIGKLVFGALNKIELILATLISIGIFKMNDFSLSSHFPILLVMGCLLIQTFYLLPVLDARADAIIAGTPPPASKAHIIYIIGEVLKMIGLLWFGISFLRNALKTY